MFTLLMEALASMLYFTGYIRSQSFARPLSREEEERCIALLAQKDAHAREQLIEHNLRPVSYTHLRLVRLSISSSFRK